jgi:hypothetical protein
MPQRPSAVSLMVCDQVVFEHTTQKPYLLGVFTGMTADSFPTGRQKFDVFAALTDGLGDVRITLSVVMLESDEEIYSRTMVVRFSDPLQVVNLRFRVRQLSFEAPGAYLVSLVVDNTEIAARRIRVHLAGETECALQNPNAASRLQTTWREYPYVWRTMSASNGAGESAGRGRNGLPCLRSRGLPRRTTSPEFRFVVKEKKI